MSDIEISEGAEPRRIAERLIPEHHPHLRDATIRYLFTTQRRKKCDRVRLGSAAKVPALVRYLASGEAQSVDDGPDFILLFGLSEWDGTEDTAGLTPAQRVALVDHELSHCSVTYDQEGNPKYVIVGHDVEEFSGVIMRHGLWKSDLLTFGDAVGRQLKLAVG